MMIGLGVGGVAVGMFHLITHAFFKALLFLGAGSVIHGCHEEQDIRCMGGLRKYMPVTFATYAIGMMALSGVPIIFSGFWSKDEILHFAHGWSISHWPFYLGIFGAFLTAFYMTRQVLYVFFGNCRPSLGKTTSSERHTLEHAGLPAAEHPSQELAGTPQESPRAMILPLVILAVFSILLGFLGTPAWPWFQEFLSGAQVSFNFGKLVGSDVLRLMLLSSAVVLGGIFLGWWLYGRRPLSGEVDVLERLQPDLFRLLRRKYFVDEIYEWSVVRFNAWWARACNWLDQWVWDGLIQVLLAVIVGLSWVNRFFDEYVVNRGFDEGCRRVAEGGGLMSRLQNGRVQSYLRLLGIALAVLVLVLLWGCHAS
jgi:NADH-quinone oxidoreductase subunit L